MAYIGGPQRTISQRKADRLFAEAESHVPNARLTELHSFDVVDRTDDELMDEAIRRERLFEREGALALLLDVRAQQVTALTNPKLIERDRENAHRTIKDIDDEIAAMRSSVH